jgi:peptidyl-dipeptidase Dcp
MSNPLLQEWNTPFNTPPFPSIGHEHFVPAVKTAIENARAEINTITANGEPADFQNTIEALELSGSRLGDITAILFNLNSAETCKELQKAAQEISPQLASFSNDITLNKKLFERVSHVYENRLSSGLNSEQEMLVRRTYRSFVLGGAGLAGAAEKRFRELSEELAGLTLKFEENVLDETNSFELNIVNAEDLAGLPEGIVETASQEADKRNKQGWIFTLHYPCYVPFMQYSEIRELREKMYRAFSSRAYHGDDKDNSELTIRIANLRRELAEILGFNNYAEMILAERMAGSVKKVESFLEELHNASRPAAMRDLNEVKAHSASLGMDKQLEKWDWAFYSEKLKLAKFNIDDEVLRPYFTLQNTEKAIFDLATRLFGITFKESDEIPLYHPEVKTFEVKDDDGSLLALLYLDYFPRPGKSGGAWMTNYRGQRMEGKKDIRPLISIVTNFPRPTATKPSLLSFSEVTTFLHEFGHALHGMLTRCTYESLSGTGVLRDFVELPSQFMENYAYEEEWTGQWAMHYETGDKIPFEIVEKIRESSKFNEGYACNRQLGFAFLDMAWHTSSAPLSVKPSEFEKEALSNTELFPAVEGTCQSTSFTHIFGGGYAAGYYGYKWAEVLDADAFAWFREKGVFNRETAESFRKNILEKGGTENPMDLYLKFRGREPSIESFLERSGLK